MPSDWLLVPGNTEKIWKTLLLYPLLLYLYTSYTSYVFICLCLYARVYIFLYMTFWAVSGKILIFSIEIFSETLHLQSGVMTIVAVAIATDGFMLYNREIERETYIKCREAIFPWNFSISSPGISCHDNSTSCYSNRPVSYYIIESSRVESRHNEFIIVLFRSCFFLPGDRMIVCWTKDLLLCLCPLTLQVDIFLNGFVLTKY